MSQLILVEHNDSEALDRKKSHFCSKCDNWNLIEASRISKLIWKDIQRTEERDGEREREREGEGERERQETFNLISTSVKIESIVKGLRSFIFNQFFGFPVGVNFSERWKKFWLTEIWRNVKLCWKIFSTGFDLTWWVIK